MFSKMSNDQIKKIVNILVLLKQSSKLLFKHLKSELLSLPSYRRNATRLQPSMRKQKWKM